MYNFIYYLYKLKTNERKIIAIVFDSILVYLSLQIINLINLSFAEYNIIFLVLIQIFIYIFTGQYNYFTRYLSTSDFYRFALRNIIFAGIISIFTFLLDTKYIINPIIFYILIQTCFLNYTRFLISDLFIIFKKNDNKSSYKSKVAIYGAGSAGAQLATSLRLENKYELKFFIDDNVSLLGKKLLEKKIISSKDLKFYKNKLDKVLLAMPSVSRKKRIEIVNNIKKFIPEVLEVPSVDDLMSGRAEINSLKPIITKELLGRPEQKIDESVLGNKFKDKTICITGAGGSIGSELCRQILKFKIKKLILIDNSEPSLYEINEELINLKEEEIEIVPILCDLCDFNYLRKIFKFLKIEIVFHSAAYKHVPLVELNPIAGIKNNIFSTKNICEVSLENKVQKIILISSDKAVRPTNVMGASKRLAELIFQSYADEASKSEINICFSMVRFGNVLNSSGSVVPLFRKQIMKGGPVTITHPDIVRYFMSLPEAVKLVLCSAIMANGGEVFLLDMGEPVRIEELAKQMIINSGLSIKDSKNVQGDIELTYSGLRAGEKMYEELLINSNSIPTENSKIFKAKESYILKDKLLNKIDILSKYIEKVEEDNILKILKELVPEWEFKKRSKSN